MAAVMLWFSICFGLLASLTFIYFLGKSIYLSLEYLDRKKYGNVDITNKFEGVDLKK